MLSRRDFLKLSGVGSIGLLMVNRQSKIAHVEGDPQVREGRVAYHKVTVYNRPSFESTKISVHKRDELLPIVETVIGGLESDYNRLWYFTGEGYVYSGGIQPVQTLFQEPVYDIPEYGTLGEVTVPFVDSYWKPDHPHRSYRLYFETTHWVKEIIVNINDGSTWYRLYDDRLRTSYCVPTYCLRILPDSEFSPLSPEVPSELKHILISLAEQLVLAYEDEKLVFMTRASTGTRANRTPLGKFETFHKRSTRHMTGGDLVATSYDLPGVPWVSFITDDGVSLHGTYWHNDYGTPHSHGCINLTPRAAKWLYRWTSPTVPAEKRYVISQGVGTKVHVIQHL